jgi:hypothetical protein
MGKPKDTIKLLEKESIKLTNEFCRDFKIKAKTPIRNYTMMALLRGGRIALNGLKTDRSHQRKGKKT